MIIACKKSKKSGNLYLVLIYEGVYLTFDRMVIEKVAMTIGVSNLELSKLKDGEFITI